MSNIYNEKIGYVIKSKKDKMYYVASVARSEMIYEAKIFKTEKEANKEMLEIYHDYKKKYNEKITYTHHGQEYLLYKKDGLDYRAPKNNTIVKVKVTVEETND